ncbi:MAG: YraN family protein [Gammaproteobacteria bacterium CG_4_9_14_3_um_filter_38_9]|nr:MAG: YraN family protein [Gammaproteobacteria bacterium CG_4_9_14_3_um_filter_38_9]
MVNRSLFKKNSTAIGKLAEKDAQHFLEQHGLTLLEKNFITYNSNGKKTGEIDLIMQDGLCLVFTEVKARSNTAYGNTLETISKQKQNRLIQAATQYLIQKNMYNSAYCRFDVIGIAWNQQNIQTEQIMWIKNAFEVQY